MLAQTGRFAISLADKSDRTLIYETRHEVYARELRQHAENDTHRLRDALDEVNTYLVAKRAGEIVVFISVTPPNDSGYSIDRHFRREQLPLIFDQGLYEVRLLTVKQAYRSTVLAFSLMYAALRYAECRGATTLAAIGRLEVLSIYRRVGLQPLVCVLSLVRLLMS